MSDVALYHWSPTPRRRSIQRSGLVPGNWSTDRLWKPPYVAFADSPSLAWALSGQLRRGEQPAWDLWMVWTSSLDGFEKLPFDDDGGIKEYRVYHRIWKRDCWYVGTREAR